MPTSGGPATAITIGGGGEVAPAPDATPGHPPTKSTPPIQRLPSLEPATKSNAVHSSPQNVRTGERHDTQVALARSLALSLSLSLSPSLSPGLNSRCARRTLPPAALYVRLHHQPPLLTTPLTCRRDGCGLRRSQPPLLELCRPARSRLGRAPAEVAVLARLSRVGGCSRWV